MRLLSTHFLIALCQQRMLEKASVLEHEWQVLMRES